MKKFRNIVIILFFIFLIIITIINVVIIQSSQSYLYDDVRTIPKSKVGLVLGTSKYFMTGDKNPYFKKRIISAVKLYQYGKIKYIILSGDNSEKYYNEPETMRRELIKFGIPKDVIYLDYAGFRTWDSILRCNLIFGQEDFTIISQEFHNTRAVYIARKNGISAIAYNANISESRSLRVRVREVFARVKVFLDLIIHKEPKYLGDEITIG
ncbi:MAG: ElyC/SanA/YdcF family protein [Candidatus Marinimicrobia bacterium]|nr:ElyC/SanA/YdcF family protein [Candidatus Neomarinimicrobiota bacterium]